MVGAGLYKLTECKDLSVEEMDFIIHHHKQFEDTRILSVAKLLGTAFTVEEIRSWGEGKSEEKTYKAKDNVILPMTLVLKPELRESLKKMVGNSLEAAGGYTAKKGEKVISLGQVSAEDFQYFLRHKKLPERTIQSMLEEG